MQAAVATLCRQLLQRYAGSSCNAMGTALQTAQNASDILGLAVTTMGNVLKVRHFRAS